MVPSSVSRHPEINFFGPQESSYLSLGATSELKDTQTTACRVAFQIKSSIKRVRRRRSGRSVLATLLPKTRSEAIDLSTGDTYYRIDKKLEEC